MKKFDSDSVLLENSTVGDLVPRCPAVLLDVEGSTVTELPKWVQVAETGEFLGYAGGSKPFSFTREIFEQIVKNFRTHPAFKTDGTGRGVGAVVPWDFHHASEMNPTDGNIAAIGTPSQGWTYDLKIVDVAGASQLWALTKFEEPARGYVKTGQYRWASVAVAFNVVDQKTAENVGAVLTSIALTNQPFIEGMAELVAEASKHGTPTKPPKGALLRYMYFEPAGNAEEAVNSFRDLFGLTATAGVDKVLEQIVTLETQISSGQVPLGVDVNELLSGMRRILNLPALSSEEEVFAEAMRIVSALIQESTGGTSSDEPNDPALPDGGQLSKGENEMSLKVLASKLGVKENEESVVSAVQGLIALSDGLAEILGLDSSTSHDVRLKKVQEQAASDGKTRDMLSAIFEAAGVEDPSSAVEVIAGKIADAKKLAEVMPELEALQKAKQEAATAEAEADVDEVMNSRGFEPGMKTLLMKARIEDKEAFEKSFPKLDPSKAHLTQSHFANSKGAQLAPTAQGKAALSFVTTKDGQVALAATPASKAISATPGADIVNLSKFAGRNKTERALAYLASKDEGFTKLSRDAQFEKAFALVRRDDVIDDPAA